MLSALSDFFGKSTSLLFVLFLLEPILEFRLFKIVLARECAGFVDIFFYQVLLSELRRVFELLIYAIEKDATALLQEPLLLSLPFLEVDELSIFTAECEL
jgi:hypothetical protein